MRTALIIVDVQRDFLPGGALAVPDGDKVIEPLLALARDADVVVATRDWHPVYHSSFTDHGGQWPRHCVAFSSGAEIPQSIEDIAHTIVSKGIHPDDDGYSGFAGTELEELLRALHVERVLIGGLATDYCVKATAEDARRLGFEVEIVADVCRGIDADASAAVLAEFAPTYRTKTGKVLTDADIQALADEAEQGYDLVGDPRPDPRTHPEYWTE